MMFCRPTPRSQRVSRVPPPDAAYRIIHSLARKVAMCSQLPRAHRDVGVVVTVRGRPVDRHGRAGCHVEIWTLGRQPPGGLRAVCSAGDDPLWPTGVPARPNRISGQPTAFSCTLGLDGAVLGGWRVTLDLRWPAE